MKGKITSTKSERMKFVLTDWITANISFLLFNVLRYFYSENPPYSFESLCKFIGQTKLCLEQALVPLIMLCVYWLSGFYNRPFGKSRFSEFLNTAVVSAIITILLHLALLTNDQVNDITANILQIVFVFIIFFAFTILGRLIVINSQIHHFRNRDWKYSTVIVGNTEKAHQLAKRLEESKAVISYSIEGFFSIPGECDCNSDAWNLDNIKEICRNRSVNQIILVPQKFDEENILGLLYQLFPLGISIKLSPDMLNFMTSTIKLKDIYGHPFVDLTHSSISDSEKNIKRTFDVVMSIITLLVLSPLFLILALWVKLDSHGSVFYKQKRIGLKEKPFDIIKFRTMYPDAENNGPQLSNDYDPRVTKAGKIMRKYRLDELPQFWNVLRGDMSIVGPRPEREFFIKQIVKKAPYYTLLYQTRPGITSWGMVQYGYASNIDEMVERSKYDLIYMSNMSILVDLKIMLYTILTILNGKGK